MRSCGFWWRFLVFDGCTWSWSACHFFLCHGSPRWTPCGKHFDRVTLLDRFHTYNKGVCLVFYLRLPFIFGSSSSSNSRPSSDSPTASVACDTRAGGHPRKCRADDCADFVNISNPACGGHDGGSTETSQTATSKCHIPTLDGRGG